MEEKDVIKVIEKMSEFMENTNRLLADLKLQIINQQIDIDKLRKENKRNGRLVGI